MWKVLSVLLGAAVVSPLAAQSGPLTFEGLADSSVLTNEYAGATFANALILASGITLNEFEFPPHAGNNVASDNGGPITIVFATPVLAFRGYFTYSVALGVQAFDASNTLLQTANSAFSNNQALSGASGSHPNELLGVSSATSIYKIVLTGSPQGTSFTLDDAGIVTRCDLNMDGFTNVGDAQTIVNEALGSHAPADDLNQDGVVNVVDVQIVINAALGSVCEAR